MHVLSYTKPLLGLQMIWWWSFNRSASLFSVS
jgi:hypothetical protein